MTSLAITDGLLCLVAAAAEGEAANARMALHAAPSKEELRAASASAASARALARRLSLRRPASSLAERSAQSASRSSRSCRC